MMGKSPDEMKQQENYAGWDFSEVWTIAPGQHDGLPLLRWQMDPEWNAIEHPIQSSKTAPIRVVTEDETCYLSLPAPLTLEAVYDIAGNALTIVSGGSNSCRIAIPAQTRSLFIVYRDGAHRHTLKYLL